MYAVSVLSVLLLKFQIFLPRCNISSDVTSKKLFTRHLSRNCPGGRNYEVQLRKWSGSSYSWPFGTGRLSTSEELAHPSTETLNNTKCNNRADFKSHHLRTAKLNTLKGTWFTISPLYLVQNCLPFLYLLHNRPSSKNPT